MTGVLQLVSVRLRWWRALRRHSPFVSFAAPLRKLCQSLSPRTVLEFGPGYSTSLLIRYTTARIISVETDPGWYELYRRMFSSQQRLRLICRQPPWDLGELLSLEPSFPFVFVDGGDRLSELLFCYDLLDERGVVFLHDAHREDLEEGIRRYPFVHFAEFHSCVLSKSESVHEHVKRVVGSDFSRPSAYVSSPERQRYLAQFIEER